MIRSNFRHAAANRNTAAKTNQAGMSLPLMALFIAVSALLVYAVVFYGTRYINKTKVSNEIAAIVDQKANVSALGSRVGVFTAANSSLTALGTQNFFPAGMVTGTATAPVVTNQWGGAITVAVGTVALAGDSIAFTRTNVPDAACTELGTGLDNAASIISINGTVTKANGVAANPATVATACTGTTDNNNVVITLAR